MLIPFPAGDFSMLTRISLLASKTILMAAIAVALGLAITPWAAAANLAIGGNVSTQQTVTVTADPGATNLDVDVAGTHTNIQVAVANERNNDNDGYTVTLQSANALAATSSQARLNRVGGGGQLNYSIRYGGAAVTLNSSGLATVTDVNVKTGPNGVDKNVQVTFVGEVDSVSGLLLTDGAYSDSLTLTLVAK